jgi:hypothetical protein
MIYQLSQGIFLDVARMVKIRRAVGVCNSDVHDEIIIIIIFPHSGEYDYY